jgi:hypothetical protein
LAHVRQVSGECEPPERLSKHEDAERGFEPNPSLGQGTSDQSDADHREENRAEKGKNSARSDSELRQLAPSAEPTRHNFSLANDGVSAAAR